MLLKRGDIKNFQSKFLKSIFIVFTDDILCKGWKIVVKLRWIFLFAAKLKIGQHFKTPEKVFQISKRIDLEQKLYYYK